MGSVPAHARPPAEEDAMNLSERLHRLARLPAASTPFLSLYLNTRWDSEKERERVRIFVKTRLKESLARAEGFPVDSKRALGEDAEKVEQYVRGMVNREWDEACDGVAVFSCSGLGVHEIVRSQIPFEDLLVCSDRPVLRPAAEQAHSGERSVFALVNGNGGRLVEFELGGMSREFSFQDEEFPGRHDQGGWSQARYQRQVEEHLTRNLRRLCEHLIRWIDERHIGRVALSGPSQLLALFEACLPKRAQECVCARLNVDPNLPTEALHSEALRALDTARVEEDRRDADELLGKILGTGRAVVGPEAVAQAVRGGRVRTLYVDKGFREKGWKCPGCGAMGGRTPQACPDCSGAVEAVELGEELVRGVLAADGKVVTVVDHDGIGSVGGAAARLRYS